MQRIFPWKFYIQQGNRKHAFELRNSFLSFLWIPFRSVEKSFYCHYSTANWEESKNKYIMDVHNLNNTFLTLFHRPHSMSFREAISDDLYSGNVSSFFISLMYQKVFLFSRWCFQGSVNTNVYSEAVPKLWNQNENIKLLMLLENCEILLQFPHSDNILKGLNWVYGERQGQHRKKIIICFRFISDACLIYST